MLKDLRLSKGLTQDGAAKLIGISRRGYQEIEYANKEDSRSYKDAVRVLSQYNLIDEEHGILTIENIQDICNHILSKYDVEYAIVFGSYARGEAKEDSDVDILISTSISGIKYFGIVEELRQGLHKKVDLVRTVVLKDSPELVLDILKDGIKVYEASKK